MTTFREAYQVRLALKMKYSQHAWYSSSVVFAVDDGFGVVIEVSQMNDKIRKLISPVVNGVSVRAEVR